LPALPNVTFWLFQTVEQYCPSKGSGRSRI
jgi:hypothetical protein